MGCRRAEHAWAGSTPLHAHLRSAFVPPDWLRPRRALPQRAPKGAEVAHSSCTCARPPPHSRPADQACSDLLGLCTRTSSRPKRTVIPPLKMPLVTPTPYTEAIVRQPSCRRFPPPPRANQRALGSDFLDCSSHGRRSRRTGGTVTRLTICQFVHLCICLFHRMRRFLLTIVIFCIISPCGSSTTSALDHLAKPVCLQLRFVAARW